MGSSRSFSWWHPWPPGLVERAPISFPMIFLGLGFLLGEHGLGRIKIDLHDTALETIATLSLSFVLFLDAINLSFDEIRKDWMVPVPVAGTRHAAHHAVDRRLAAALLLAFPLIQSFSDRRGALLG